MSLDRILTDPIISTENATFSPATPSPPQRLPLPSEPSEQDPLLGARTKKPFYRARPLWLVPFAFSASLARGMTVASRLEVFTELACRQVNFNHTSTPHLLVAPHLSLDSAISHLYLPSPVRSWDESQGDGVGEGDDPRVVPGKKCVSDPAVQAGTAKLQTIMTTTMGALSAITTGWWGRFGERHGRTRVLAITTFGLFLTDLIFILVSTPDDILAAHSHKLLILAPIVEGSLGGWSTFSSATTAYIADCTSPGSRATIFARFTGLLSVGLALGPVIGAWLIRNPIPFLKVGQANHPLQSVNSVFWVAISVAFVNFVLVLLIFPESLPASRRAMNRKGKNRAVEGDEIATNKKHTHKCIVTRAIKSFISPLGVFLPTDVPMAHSPGMPNKLSSCKDWCLTYLGLSFFVYVLAAGFFQIKYLYAEHIYDWTAEQLNYYISFTGALRASYLLVLLPFLLATFKPVRAAVAAQLNPDGTVAKPKPTKGHLFSEIRFDLFVIRLSMCVELCSHILVVLFPLPTDGTVSTWWSQCMFVGATSLAGVGAGIVPALQSMALCTLQGHKLAEREELVRLQGGVPTENEAAPESGKLFGAIAVVQAIGQSILGPILFGVIYSSTVASFPKAMFAVAASLIMIAMLLTWFVRPDVSLAISKNSQKKAKHTAANKHRPEQVRGRSRRSKDLRGGSASTSYGSTRNDASVSTGRTEAGTSHA